jgi:hypothetical protein
MWAALSATYLAMFLFAYRGHRSHHGFLFIYLVVSVWLSGGLPATKSRVLFGVLFVLQAAIGLYAFASDVAQPYSDGRPVADAIRDQKLERLPLVGVRLADPASFYFEVDRVQPVLLGIPGGRVYDPYAGRFELFWRFYDRPTYSTRLNRAQLIPRLSAIAQRLESDLLLVVVYPDRRRAVALPVELRELATPPPAMDYGEQLALYLYQRRVGNGHENARP